ncbi:PQQ-dependent sugar dehydrogenase [Halorarum halobium]|uniref:PQQ-dependent sugar dehydrogenase n=1 Tax=Halorarum halobium TaxID=3075121 RepID=UPI0028B0A6B8|nr:PQQ-dependent sugar dehydrogenase [Halobaculum sp. XH14]
MPPDETSDRHEQASTDEAGGREPRGTWRTSRRRLLGAAAAGGIASGFAGASFAQQTTVIELLGVTPGWEYEGDTSAPYIGGTSTTNPTLRLQPGQEYEVTWENGDGQPHNFVVQDDQGNDLVRTELMSEQGATQTVTFTASEEMTTYLCEAHPNTMIGDVETAGGSGGGTDALGNTGFFAPGTEVGYETVAEGMTAPTDFAVADGEQERYFVADQTGELWVVTPEGGRRSEPFVDVSDLMVELGTFYGSYASQTQSYDERGLLGVEFHPEFASNGRFYLHYSAPPTQELIDMGWDHVEVVSEFQAAEDLSSASADSETRLLSIPSPQYNHDGGPIAFGPDGYLYVPMGDGGGANDDMYGHVDDWYDANAGGNGQDVEDNLLGDVLRIDVDGGDAAGDAGTGTGTDTPTGTPAGTATEDGTGTPEGTETAAPGDGDAGARNYGIPEDNPFAGEDTPGLDEIYAYGFRNPFGISFDGEGNLFVADAGQNLWEEADLVENGGNYGWNVKEGTHCFSTEDPSQVDAVTDCPDTEPNEAPYDGSELQDPIVEFPHQYEGESVGITIVGGHRYEASTIPGLTGKYVYGVWTSDPARAEPDGRVLTATPPAGFDSDGATTTPDGTGTAGGNESDAGTAVGNETGGGTETGTGTGTGTGTPGGPSEGDVPRDELWEMEELVFTEGFSFFVRMFGRDNDGELYVLVNEEGVPEGDTGRVVRIVPPEEGETPEETGTPTGTDAVGNETDATGTATGTAMGNETTETTDGTTATDAIDTTNTTE